MTNEHKNEYDKVSLNEPKVAHCNNFCYFVCQPSSGIVVTPLYDILLLAPPPEAKNSGERAHFIVSAPYVQSRTLDTPLRGRPTTAVIILHITSLDWHADRRRIARLRNSPHLSSTQPRDKHAIPAAAAAAAACQSVVCVLCLTLLTLLEKASTFLCFNNPVKN